jgi:CDP-paratose 2-epimerase
LNDSYVITGGAGFIGTNLAAHYLSRGDRVTIIDNFSRRGSEANAEWLSQRGGDRLRVVASDVRALSPEAIAALQESRAVFHLAAQVAVTTSVLNPEDDFAINALGTFNVLEAVRTAASSKPALVYSSTNKVYGKLEHLDVREGETRWELSGQPGGVAETCPLDFYSPYGCSKGSADQYVRDYARIYNLDTVVFRQSCIYGPHQFGIEDQGWVAWFALQAAKRRPVSIFGTGKQVRDLLYVDDLIAAYVAAVEHIKVTRGQVYNIGGGPENCLSVMEVVGVLQRHFGYPLEVTFDEWRPGDQMIYISDVSKAARDFSWAPTTDPATGIAGLLAWLQESAVAIA